MDELETRRKESYNRNINKLTHFANLFIQRYNNEYDFREKIDDAYIHSCGRLELIVNNEDVFNVFENEHDKYYPSSQGDPFFGPIDKYPKHKKYRVTDNYVIIYARMRYSYSPNEHEHHFVFYNKKYLTMRRKFFAIVLCTYP